MLHNTIFYYPDCSDERLYDDYISFSLSCVFSEGSEVGKVSWSIDLTGSGFVVQSVKLTLNSKVFESGRVNALICGGDCCVKLPSGRCDEDDDTVVIL